MHSTSLLTTDRVDPISSPMQWMLRDRLGSEAPEWESMIQELGNIESINVGIKN